MPIEHTRFGGDLQFDIVDYLDKVTLRLMRKPSNNQMQFLRDNCRSANYGKGRPVSNPLSPFREHELLLTIVKPNRYALEWLADGNLPHAVCSYVECARDFLTADRFDALRLFDRFIFCHYHKCHGKHQTRIIDDTYYSGERRAGRWFAAYCDKPSKITNGHCLHIELRVQGMRALEQLGVYTLRDLLVLYDNPGEIWRHNLKLVDIDLEQLGIYDSNRRSKLKRRKPLIDDPGPRQYNRDERAGAVLLRSSGWIPRFVTIGQKLSVQAFVSQYGTGPFLKPLSIL
jgi:hypothetical protein